MYICAHGVIFALCTLSAFVRCEWILCLATQSNDVFDTSLIRVCMHTLFVILCDLDQYVVVINCSFLRLPCSSSTGGSKVLSDQAQSHSKERATFTPRPSQQHQVTCFIHDTPGHLKASVSVLKRFYPLINSKTTLN